MEVRRNEQRSRYELVERDAVVGVADYREHGDGVVVMPHTEIHPERRGDGLGAMLVGRALEDLRARHATVVPACWFVAQFIDEHPDYADLVAA